MTRAKLFTAAAVLSSLIASPALAQGMAQNVTYQHRSDRAYDRDHARSGFWPADVAAGVVGGAVGTAGAIATAPFRNDGYAYNNGYAYGDRNSYNDAYAYDNGPFMDRGPFLNDGRKEASSMGPRYSNPYSYAARNGFVCQPGTLTRMEDGEQHICQ